MEAIRTNPSASTGPIRPCVARHPTRSDRRPVRALRRTVAGVVPALLLAGCSLVATPDSPPVGDGPFVPIGAMGYVVCPTSVTPVQLASRTAEAAIALPVRGTPSLGTFAIGTTPDGRTAYVATQSTTGDGAVQNVLVPIDLASQRAGRPVALPGDDGPRAVVVTHDGRTVLVAIGSTIVPVDRATRAVGTPLDLGTGRTIAGMALSPTSTILYALVPDGVVPVDTATARAGAPVVTGLTVSSVTSPHGVVVGADGATVYVVGQGGSDFGGRLVPIHEPAGTVGPATGFDQFGIADPSAVTLTADGATVLVADSANNWILPVPAADLAAVGGPVRLPTGRSALAAGTDHPSDIVTGPGSTGAFVVAGLDTVLPFDPTTGTFGRPVRVCEGASSMAVAG